MLRLRCDHRHDLDVSRKARDRRIGLIVPNPELIAAVSGKSLVATRRVGLEYLSDVKSG